MPDSANPWATELKAKKTKKNSIESAPDSFESSSPTSTSTLEAARASNKGKRASRKPSSSTSTPHETEERDIGGEKKVMHKVSKAKKVGDIAQQDEPSVVKKKVVKKKKKADNLPATREGERKLTSGTVQPLEEQKAGSSSQSAGTKGDQLPPTRAPKLPLEKVPPPPDSLEVGESKNIYEEARNHLKKTKEFQPGVKSKTLPKADEGDNDENPVERLIRQDSRMKEKKLIPNDPSTKAQGQANTREIETQDSGMYSSGSKKSSVSSPKGTKKSTQEYLLLNYPRDVRKNLKDLVLPEDLKRGPKGPTKGAEEGEDWEEDEWEWEEDEDVPEEEPEDASNCNGVDHNEDDEEDQEDSDDAEPPVKGVPDIKIKGNILKIERKDIVWSDDEYDDESPPDSPIESSPPMGNAPFAPPPPPPMPNGIPVAPPPPPPPLGKLKVSMANPEKVAQLKKRPTTRPVWTDLMKEIEVFKNGHGKLQKVVCNDRSRPVLIADKSGDNFDESEEGLVKKDILKDIRKGIKLKHVRTVDKSRPCLRGIRNFRRQTTKEDRIKNEFAFDEEEEGLEGVDDDENAEELRDDLESTKQLLELEVRSKKLLEKDNKRLQVELERLRSEFQKMSTHKQEGHEGDLETQAKINSVANKRRQSIVRLLSESDVPSMLAAASANEEQQPRTTIAEEDEPSEPTQQFESLPKFVRGEIPAFENEVIETMKEEVDEARKLAEEWELKYKEMQRQMVDLDGGRRGAGDAERRASVVGNDPGYQRMASNGSNFQEPADDEDEETWMQRREVHQLGQKLRTIADKREIVVRERKLLNERMDTIMGNIGQEIEARKKLKKDLKEMNEAFKEEIMGMESEELTKAELEECYYSDEESLVPSKTQRVNSTESEEESEDYYDDDMDETLEDILKLAEDEEEEDPGHSFFDHYPESEDESEEVAKADLEGKVDKLHGRIDQHGENLQTMRKSNFLLKSKIDRLYDILQMQREKHHDLKQELARMLSDIQ